MGFDHPQWEMYSTSKHGAIYQQTAHETNWDVPLKDWYKEAPATTKR